MCVHYTILNYIIQLSHYCKLHVCTIHYTILYYTIKPLLYTLLYYTLLYYTIKPLLYTTLYYTILYYTIKPPVVGHTNHAPHTTYLTVTLQPELSAIRQCQWPPSADIAQNAKSLFQYSKVPGSLYCWQVTGADLQKVANGANAIHRNF